jgi:hypothetical protein
LPTARVDWFSSPWLRPWFEARAGLMLASMWYGELPQGAFGAVPYWRFPASLLAVWPFSENIYWGIGPGIEIGTPVLMSDSHLVGGPQTAFMPVWVGGYRPGQGAVALEAEFRLLSTETVYAYTTDYHSQTVHSASFPNTGFFEIHVRIGR